MANKLKNMLLKSVDLVRRGANPDADIKLYKSFYGDPNEQEFMKSADEIEEMLLKSDSLIDGYTDVLKESLSSIVNDESLTGSEAREMMAKSIAEFNETFYEDVIKEFSYTAQENEEEGDDDQMANINRKNLSKEENDQLDNLLKKACGGKKVEKEDPEIVIEDDEPEEDPMQKERDDLMEMEKSMHPAVKAALERMETLTKGLEMKELEELAKKYEPLGEKSDELAKTLYDMKQQGEDVYKQYVSVLDKSLDVINKSGLFGEIGKSAYYGGVAKSDAEGKIEVIAGEIAKSNPNLTRQQAIAKAWEQNPELAMEYETGRR